MDRQKKIDLINDLIAIADELGWSIGMECGVEEKLVSGIVLGTPEYIMQLLSGEILEFEIFEKESSEEQLGIKTKDKVPIQ